MKRLALIAFAIGLTFPTVAQDRQTKPGGGAVVERNVMVPMRDGVKLATDIARPVRDVRFPVILSRTPYGKKLGGGAGMVRGGVAVAVQDVRGRYASEGEFYPFIHDPNDGYDTIEWLAKQPWCNGDVFMAGGSYVGFTQSTLR